jgi:hypothetical protein
MRPRAGRAARRRSNSRSFMTRSLPGPLSYRRTGYGEGLHTNATEEGEGSIKGPHRGWVNPLAFRRRLKEACGILGE